MKLIFKKIRWKNFLSTGNFWTEIDLNKNKTTLIVGKNGSGKSTLTDAISFSLFNKPFRNINKGQLVNTITNKDCLVECEFEINNAQFKVVRGIKPNIFEIYKNDELLTQTAEIKDYQEAFEKYILKINHKSFCQVVMLGSAIFTPFMSLAKQQRREVIEDLIDLKIFTIMNNLLKVKISENDYLIYEKDNEKTIINERIKLTQRHIDQLQENSEKKKKEKEDKVIELENVIEKYFSEISTKQRELSEINVIDGEKVEKKIKEIIKIQAQLQQKNKALEKEISFLNENEECPTCHQIIDENFKSNSLQLKEQHQKELTEGLQRISEEYKKTNNVLKEISLIQKTISEKNEDILVLNTKIKNSQRQIEDLLKELKEPNDISEDENRLQQYNLDLAVIEEKIKQLNENRTMMGYAATLLKDTGIKAKIIKTYMPIINQLLSKYTAALDFFVDFQLNEEFQEIIKSRHRDEFSYESFSEGEKLRLNLAILFTWRSIAKMRNSIDTNLLIFDEILDASLDIDGVEYFIKLLNEITDTTNVLIISHKDQISDKFDRILQVEKVKNFSTVIEK